jgi:hypothetical protein
MTDSEDRPFSEEEAARLRTYPEPPRQLEDRVVRALREAGDGPAKAGHHNRKGVASGFSRTRGAGFSRTVLIAIAASALLAFGLGRWTAPAPVGDRGEFVLFVQDAPGEERMSPNEVSQRVREFASWARDLRARDLLASAEKLDDGGTVLTAGAAEPLTAADRAIGGFFVIRASTPDEAASIARGAPNLKHGGRIVVRRFDRR